MFDLMRLKLLRELAYRGTMTAVGEAFGLTSSAVSQQLATLENEAHATLLERVGRRVRLTSEGMRLVGHAEIILKAAEAAEMDLRVTDQKPRGTLEVASFPTFAKAHLLPAIIRLRNRYPELQVIIRELESVDAINAVRNGECHLATSFAYNLAPYPTDPGLVFHELINEPVLLALPQKWRRVRQPVSLKRLAEENWIVGSRQSDDWQLAERACAIAGFVPRIIHTVDDYDLVLKMVAAGLGVGFVPELALSFPSAKKVAIHTAAGMPLRRHIHAVTRAALAASPLVRAVLAELPSTD